MVRRMGFAVNFRFLMVISELVASTNGIGYGIQNAQLMFLLTDCGAASFCWPCSGQP